MAHGTPATWIAAYAHASSVTQVLALHVYGTPLSYAITDTYNKRVVGRRLWFTEIGCAGDAPQLLQALYAVNWGGVERVYVYALWSPDDGYTLTTDQQSVIRSFLP